MTENLHRLIDIMARLRHPTEGCPWDVEQDFASIAPYTIEEAYEVADAIEKGDREGLREELGDLLLQVVFHARIAEEEGSFAFDDVARAISDKMVRRHPHVFEAPSQDGSDGLREIWEGRKAAERAEKARAAGRAASVLDDVPIALPALTRAEKLQKRAARVGFDWPDTAPVAAKIEEELDELRAEMASDGGPERLAEEAGDLLFACVNLLRHLKVDPEAALRAANGKFERRFQAIEAGLAAEGRSPADATLDEMEERWQAAKGTAG